MFKQLKIKAMKIKLFIMTICLALVLMNAEASKTKTKTKVHTNYASTITGKSLSDFGDYKVAKCNNPLVLDGVELKTYQLEYSNSEQDIRIGVIPEKKCTSFILKAKTFEVEYVCKNGVFGVKKIRKAYQEIPKDMNEAVLDKEGYFTQRVISQKPKTEGELLGLIACYFPNLIKDEYQGTF